MRTLYRTYCFEHLDTLGMLDIATSIYIRGFRCTPHGSLSPPVRGYDDLRRKYHLNAQPCMVLQSFAGSGHSYLSNAGTEAINSQQCPHLPRKTNETCQVPQCPISLGVPACLVSGDVAEAVVSASAVSLPTGDLVSWFGFR